SITRQPRKHPQFDQCRPPTASSFPLPPQSSPKPQPDPACKVSQQHRRFAEAEIAAPAPHIGDQFLHRRLHADALCPSRDLPNSCLKPIQSLRRNGTLDLCTGRKGKSALGRNPTAYPKGHLSQRRAVG